MRSRNPIRLKTIAAIIFLTADIFLCGTAAAHASPERITAEQVEQIWQAAKQALHQQEGATAKKLLLQLIAIAPEHPTFLLNLARAEVQVGEYARAVATLQQVVDMGFGSEIVADDEFAPLQSRADFKIVERRAAELKRRIVSARSAFAIDEPDLIPEGMAYDSKTHLFYVSSMYKRKVVQVTRAGEKRDFISEGQNGIWKVLGMKVDQFRRELVVCSSADDPQMRSFDPKDLGHAGVFIFDVSNGRLLRKYTLERGKHLFNDLVIAKSGDIFVTDSEEGSVYEIPARKPELQRVSDVHAFLYPNGIALSPDERLLYIAEIPGIQVLNVKTNEVFRLPHPHTVSLVEIDGMYAYGGDLLAIQNGVHPNRVIRIVLNANGDAVVRAVPLERDDPVLDSPTTGAIAGSEFYFIANSQMNSFDEQNHIFPLDKLKPVVILRLDLSASGRRVEQ